VSASFVQREGAPGLLSELNLSRRRRLPVVLGAEAAECGLCCMTMIARYWGHDVDLNGMRQRFSFSISGATLRSLMDIAAALDLSARALRVEMSALTKLRMPAILHWDFSHFVVLKSVSKTTILIHDPAFGERRLTPAEVSRHFTGVALELAPGEGFAKKTAAEPTKLRSLFSSARGLWSAGAQILLLSAMLQLAVFAAPFQLQLVVDEAIFRADAALLNVLALGFGALVVMQAALEALRGWTLRYVGALLSFQLVGNLFRHLLRLPADFFHKRHVGDIMSRINSATPIQEAVTKGVAAALIDGVMALIAGAIIVAYSPLLAAVVVAGVLVNLAVAWVVYPIMRGRMQEEIQASAKERSHVMETIRASTTIKLMGREADREAAWRNLYAEVVNNSFSVGKYQIALAATQVLASGLQTVLVVFLAARLILAGEGFSVGMLFAFLSFRQTFTDRSLALINQTLQFRLLGLHLERLGDIINAEPEGWRTEGAALAVRGEISLRNASFRYGVADPLVLNGVDLTIAAGEYVAIVGPSGGGKSTLLKLLLGLYPPTSGTLEIEGRPASPELMRLWRARAGVVSQEDRLLSGTLAENIAFFDPDLDMTRVVAAATAAHVHREIAAMPMQYRTLVGDMGSSLSGGQKQRILLARALYRQPQILFLDEGTANLDEANEAVVADLIAAMTITRIVVAHRPALIERADRVLALDRGKLRPRELSLPALGREIRT